MRLADILSRGLETLASADPELHDLLQRESDRQRNVLSMVAASSVADPSVLVCEGSPATNVTAEGYPGARFHGGAELVDGIERLAIDRARRAFRARYANVQPHSGTSANLIVMLRVLEPGDVILGMDLDSGGHLSHGSPASVVGKLFRALPYGLTPDGRIDLDQVRRLALEHHPRLIVCGASAYPRRIDFEAFRAIADEAGALLLADISHIAGLVVAGEHPSPIDAAHFTTTSTYKQLFGPRGGLILLGRDADAAGPDGKGTLAEAIQSAVFPFAQGTPSFGVIAGKARALARVLTEDFRALARRIVASAATLAAELAARGYPVVTGGTDNHIVLLDLREAGLSGLAAETALETCHIVANRNRIPGDRRPPAIASGLRFGTNGLAARGMGPGEMSECAELVDLVLRSVRPLDERRGEIAEDVRERVRARVDALCERFPIDTAAPGGRLES